MIVKLHSRGAGSGSGPVDYLLGKDRQRDQASVLRGDPERVCELIDSCDIPLACCLFRSLILLTREVPPDITFYFFQPFCFATLLAAIFSTTLPFLYLL